MLKTIRNLSFISYISGANRVNRFLQSLPYIGKKVPDLVQKDRTGRRAMIIAGAVAEYMWEFIRKAAYVAVFMFLPWKLFSSFMPGAEYNFTIENSFVYFTLIMSCVCGSLNNSAIFEPSDESFIMLKELKCSPLDYFRYVMVRRSAAELLTFWPSFAIFGLAPAKSFHLALVVVVTRFVGDTVNILLFRATGEPADRIKGVSVALMLLALFVAYFLPYVNGKVPQAYSNVFNTLFFLVLLGVVSVFIYYLWNYRMYDKIAAKVCDREDSETDNDSCDTDEPENQKDVLNIYDKLLEKKGSCYEVLNRMFLNDNIDGITRRIAVSVCVIAVSFIAVMFYAVVGNEDTVYKMLVLSAPFLFFIVCIMSQSSYLCENMYKEQDVNLLADMRYKRTDDRVENFIVRLKYLTVVDLIPSVFLAAAYGGMGIIVGRAGSAMTILSLMFEIILLCCFFTLYNMAVYYVVQPFRNGSDSKQTAAGVIRLVTYILCILLIYTDFTVPEYIMCIGLATGLMASILVTFVWKCGNKTFKIK